MPRTTTKKATGKKRVTYAPKKTYVRKAAPMKTVKKATASKTKKSSDSALGTAIGSAIGLALGGPSGGSLGGMVGNAGGRFLSSIFGHGDYAVTNAASLKENNLVLTNSAQCPQFGTGKVACKFVHREFLGDVFSASTANTFKREDYPINPGVSKTFPWLSGVVGAKFQQYRINGMTFEFRSMSSDALNSTNTALGSVIMSTDYDSADNPFTSKQEMENTEYGVSCKPSANMMHGIECARPQTPVSELYIRAFDVPLGKDIRLYDMGRFSIATTGCQGVNVNLGELWVSYDIDCFKAIEQVPLYLSPFATYRLNGVTGGATMGTSRVLSPANNAADLIGLTFTPNRVYFPITIDLNSVHMVNLLYYNTSTSAMTVPNINTGNGLFLDGQLAYYAAPSNLAVTGSYVACVAVKYKGGATPDALPYLEFVAMTWAGTITGDLLVNQINGGFPGTFNLVDTPDPPGYITVEEGKAPQRGR